MNIEKFEITAPVCAFAPFSLLYFFSSLTYNGVGPIQGNTATTKKTQVCWATLTN